MEWKKTGRTVYANGGSDTTYTLKFCTCGIEVQSRKRPIPHASGVGVWMYTSYFVMRDGVDICKKRSLREAKEYAEQIINEQKG